MYEQILIPTDGSERSVRSVEHGFDLAEEYDAVVHLLYVLDDHVYETPALSSSELFLEKLETSAETMLSEIEQRATDRGLTVVSTCHRGSPSDVILDYLDGHEIDLVVMGRHGSRNPEYHGHIGTCTNRVLRQAPVPVITV